MLKEHSASDYGCIKIVPPSSFKPGLAFDTGSDKKLPTRFQVLQDLSQGKAFKQNEEGRTFREFVDLAAQVEHGDVPTTTEDFNRLEKRYWDMVENNVGPRTKVEYAADV